MVVAGNNVLDRAVIINQATGSSLLKKQENMIKWQ